jgi:cyclophilin family peptidyl-prolyl cis-trans isomerase
MPTPCPAVDGSSEKRQEFDGPPPMCIDPAKRYTAVIDTSVGSMTVALDAVAAPQTVNNFVFLARYHYFDGIIFHRIIKGFMCQGGDPTGTGRGGPGYRFADELPAPGRYEIGSVAMANAGPNTNGSQFFLVRDRPACASHRSTRCSARSSRALTSSPRWRRSTPIGPTSPRVMS